VFSWFLVSEPLYASFQNVIFDIYSCFDDTNCVDRLCLKALLRPAQKTMNESWIRLKIVNVIFTCNQSMYSTVYKTQCICNVLCTRSGAYFFRKSTSCSLGVEFSPLAIIRWPLFDTISSKLTKFFLLSFSLSFSQLSSQSF